MTLEQLFKANDSLENLVMGFASDNYIRQEISNLKFSNNIDSTDDLAKIIESKKNEDRLMNIGIVGRVKQVNLHCLMLCFLTVKTSYQAPPHQ